jgi:hypothetical protein
MSKQTKFQKNLIISLNKINDCFKLQVWFHCDQQVFLALFILRS